MSEEVQTSLNAEPEEIDTNQSENLSELINDGDQTNESKDHEPPKKSPEQPSIVSEYDYLISWVIQRINLLSLDFEEDKSQIKILNNDVIVDFVTGQGPKLINIIVSNSNSREFVLHNEFKEDMVAYFLRSENTTLTRQNIDKLVQYGTIGGAAPFSIIGLERVMKGLFDKQVSQNSSLTDGARNELSSHYHRCMATLTDTVHCADGRTVLYCPAFDSSLSVSDIGHNKDLVQIIESIVIHWTRQIKTVVNNAEQSGRTEISGPLDEIEFWKGRAQDLLGIQEQILCTNVSKITEILQYAKSNYLAPFEELSKQLVAKAAEANDNLKFLESIRAQSILLREIAPEKLVEIIPDLLNRVRLIWLYSKHYNTEDRICSLLRKISNEIILRFRSHVPTQQVFDGDVDFCILRLQEAIFCGVEWKKIYHKAVENINRQKHKYGGRVWAIDDASVFAQVDAFVQRCRDLIEVCESQMQFVRKSSSCFDQPGPLPLFGGTKSQEIVDAITGIQFSFEGLIDKLKRLDYDILDVRISRWHDDYHHFKNTVKDLEVMFTNIIVSAYDNNTTITEGVILIETFHKLAKREAVKRCVERKAAGFLYYILLF